MFEMTMFGTGLTLSYQINVASLYIKPRTGTTNVSLTRWLLPKYFLRGKHLNEFISTGFGRGTGEKGKGMSPCPPKQMFRGWFMLKLPGPIDGFAESDRAPISKITN
jgi:hypothetical protein